MRGPLLTMPAIGRATGFALVAAAIVAAALHVQRGGAGERPALSRAAIRRDPLAAELARCQAIGLAAQTDAACEAAWAENRQRFFTYGRPTSGAPPIGGASVIPFKGR